MPCRPPAAWRCTASSSISSRRRPDSQPALNESAKYPGANPSVKMIVAKYTDWKGGFDYNIDLSKRRTAVAVKS